MAGAAGATPDLAGDWVPVARLLRPQGRRGEILAEPLSGQREVFTAGQAFRLRGALGGIPREVTLESSWQPQGRKASRLVVKLRGCESISDAEALEGAELLLAVSAFPALPDDTFLVRDLVGCTLWDGDTAVGTIVDLQFPVAADGHTRLDAPDLLVVEPLQAAPESTEQALANEPTAGAAEEGDLETVLVPFVKAWLRGVRLAERQLRMELPPGFFA